MKISIKSPASAQSPLKSSAAPRATPRQIPPMPPALVAGDSLDPNQSLGLVTHQESQAMLMKESPAALFHGTSISAALRILASNSLDEGIYWGKQDEPHGPRATTSFACAQNFSRWSHVASEEVPGGVILELDGPALFDEYQLVAYRDSFYGGEPMGNEEEVAIVAPSVTGLDRFIRAIHIQSISDEELMGEGGLGAFHAEVFEVPLESFIAEYEALLAHPKARIYGCEGGAWVPRESTPSVTNSAPAVFLTSIESELDALRVLEGAMGGAAFWNPEVLKTLNDELVQAFIEQTVASMAGRAGLARLWRMKEVVEAFQFNAWDRAVSVMSDLGRAPDRLSPPPLYNTHEESVVRALCYAAGLPWELLKGIYGGTANLVNSQITWLPDGLLVPKDLWLTRAANLKYLPPGLKVGGDLDIGGSGILNFPRDLKTVHGSLGVENIPIESLPEGLYVGRNLSIFGTRISNPPKGLEVGYDLIIRRTPLAAMSDEGILREVRVGGDIIR